MTGFPLTSADACSDADQATSLWNDWRKQKSLAARDRIIEHYLPFARMMAAKLYGNRHSEEFEFDDFLQFATIGLIESIDRYTADSPAQFTTFAVKRIKGAVLDGVEKLSDKQQQINMHQRRIKERCHLVGGAILANAANTSVFDQLAEIAVGLAVGQLLDESRMYIDSELPEPDNQYRGIELQQLQDRLRILVEQLPERERLLIKYTYFNHMAFESVAQMWGVTRGRIAQMHRGALDRLRKSAFDLEHYDVNC